MDTISSWLGATPGTIFDHPTECLQTCMLSAQVCDAPLRSCNLIWWVTQALHCTAFISFGHNPSRITHMAPHLVGPHKVSCLNSQQASCHRQTWAPTAWLSIKLSWKRSLSKICKSCSICEHLCTIACTCLAAQQFSARQRLYTHLRHTSA